MEHFEHLVEKYSPMISSIMRKLNIFDQKEDYFQIGLIALWDASKNFNEAKGNFSPYAYSYIRGRILMNLKKDLGRKEQLVYPSEEFWGYVEEGHPDKVLEKEQILSYFYHLTEKQKNWVILYFCHGLTTTEIAKKEGVKHGTVKNWQNGAMKKIKLP